MARSLTTIALAAIGVAGAARAQQLPVPLTPARVAAHALRPMTDTMDIWLVRNGERRSGGRFAVGLTSAMIDGRGVFVATAHDMSPTGADTFDTLAVDAKTLAPRWHRSHAPTDSAAVEYRGRAASGYAAHANQPRTPIRFQLSPAAFESALVSWVLPSLPLESGYAVIVRSYSLWDNREDSATYRVVGSEELALHDATAQTWIVEETHGPNDTAIRKQWIDTTTRRVLQTYDAPRRAAPGDGYWKVSTRVKLPAR